MANKNPYFYCNVEGNTDVGCKRPANEDWLDSFVCDNGLVAVVCDGMGGHVGGQVASHLAVDAIRHFLMSNQFDDPKKAIVAACDTANQAILRRTMEQPELTGMGSTCVILIVRDGKVYVGSVGDSRVYLIRSKTIRQLTKDQSYVQMLVDAGEITPEQAEHHPRKNEITNALGLKNMRTATVIEDIINPEAGDCFLLCSDGLSGMVSDHEIEKVISNQQGMSQRDRVNMLIDKAKRNGGLDNITCQIVEFSVTPPGNVTSDNFQNKKKLIAILASVIAICVLSIAVFFVWKYLKNPEQEESDYVKEMRQKENVRTIKYDKDTIVFVKNSEDLFDVEQNDQFDAIVIRVQTKNGLDSITIKGSFNIKNLTTSSEDNVVKKFSGKHCYIKFNDRDFNDPDFSLTFKWEDSVCVHVFPVERPENIETITETRSPAETNKNANSEGKVVFDETDTAKVVEEGTPSQPLESTVTVNKNGETIVELKSSNGTNTDTRVYTQDAIIPTENGVAVKKGWYSYTCDGSVCKIKILGEKVPKNKKQAVIKIPLKNEGEYVIRVKTK